jgi:Flp pilus assembly pilin Flp
MVGEGKSTGELSEQQKGMNTNRERGASLVEYALLVALLCIVAIGGVRAVGASAADTLDRAGEQIGAGGIDTSFAPPEPD